MSKLHDAVQSTVRPTRALAVAPFEGFDRSASLAVQQELIDDQLAGLTEGELKLMLAITRATNGGQRESVALSVRVLCNGAAPDTLPGRGTGLSPRTVQAACTSLETAGYLRVNRRIAADGSGLPSMFTVPLIVPGMRAPGDGVSARFAGYAAGRRVRLPLLVFDRLIAELSGAELKVLLYIMRHTFCTGTADEVMAMARLVENTGLSLRHTRLALGGLTARGVVLVQRRQDVERGKLPSRFGVKVMGEAAPFAPSAGAAGTVVRAGRPEEPSSESARPVWLVPATGPRDAADESPGERARPVQERLPDAVPPAILPLLEGEAGAPPPFAASAQSRQTATDPRRLGAGFSRPMPSSMTRDINPIWASVKQILAQRLPYRTFEERVACTASVGAGGPELIIAVQDEYHRWWLESKLGQQVRDALAEAGHANIRMRYINYSGPIPSEHNRN